MNPKFAKFIEEHPNMSILGLAWALWWRLNLVIFGIYMAFAIVVVVLSALARV